MDSAEILQKLKTIKPELQEKYGLQQLALFGSYSRNEQNGQSDIDLLIDLSTPNASHFFSCAFFLEDIFYPQRVEVVSKNAIQPKYLNAIQPDLIYA